MRPKLSERDALRRPSKPSAPGHGPLGPWVNTPLHPVKAANIIYTCCVLHNIAINARLDLEDGEIERPEPEENDNHGGGERINNDLLRLGRKARALYIRDNL